ncbi:NAD kinase [Methanimicrococcus stummii]|uniref:NAD kinase n=1 Tax=Methanimicrococcus stummii TaxID=3028294 RepID=A0AA96V8V6_9EURY|nr:bifunctional fructose-bisphosphatase/inositol-phosphate phosphatase [Methanimicrococcus sp. Es2]WNY28378.1 NAD kinase [Methanimicrococcus sp. Es2]
MSENQNLSSSCSSNSDSPNPELLALCRAVYNDIRSAISSLEGTNEADEFMFVGADGTDTKRIDLAAEDAMLKRFKSSGHSVRIISEEMGETIIGDVNNIEFAAIVDPLDGTTNAIHDIPFYSVSIAFSKPDLTGIFFGYVCNLANGDEFYAEDGKGAYMNGARIETSKISTVREMTISAYGYRQNTDRTANLCSRVQKVRVLGSVALELCYVAAGKIDAFVDVRRMLRLIDIGAGQLIAREAGGIVTDGAGNTLFLPDNHIKPVNLVATNGRIHQEVLNLISFPEIDCRGDWYYYQGTVKKIAIVSRCDSAAALEMIRKIVDAFKDRVEVYLSSSPAKYLNMEERGIAVGKMKEAGIDFVISLGGDGTILRNMSKMPDPIPILGINMGTLGFLADVDPEDAIAAIDKALSGFMYDERPRLELSINGKFIGNAINEVVATSAYPAKMITYEILVNRRLLGEIRADGIVFATPTGSTAYALSAGGPIVTPEVDAILIVPIAPFKLSSRPWIVPFDSEITVRVKMPKKEIVIVTDGKVVTPPEIETECQEDFIHVNEDDVVTIKRARYPGRFVKFSDACFYDTVRKKLN